MSQWYKLRIWCDTVLISLGSTINRSDGAIAGKAVSALYELHTCSHR